MQDEQIKKILGKKILSHAEKLGLAPLAWFSQELGRDIIVFESIKDGTSLNPPISLSELNEKIKEHYKDIIKTICKKITKESAINKLVPSDSLFYIFCTNNHGEIRLSRGKWKFARCAFLRLAEEHQLEFALMAKIFWGGDGKYRRFHRWKREQHNA